MKEKKKDGDVFGIAPAVAKRLCEWADLEGTYSKEREEKFVERDGLRDQINQCEDDDEKQELKAQCFDVETAIAELARQIKYMNQQINRTLRDQKLRSQEVIDADVLGPLYAPKPEPKKHDDDPDQGKLGDGYANSDAKPLGFEPEAMTDADAQRLSEYTGPSDHEPVWTSRAWNEAPVADPDAQPLKLEIRGKYVDRWDDVQAMAHTDDIDTPTALFVLIARAVKAKQALDNFINLRLAAFLLDRVCRVHLQYPSPVVRDGLLIVGKSGLIDTIRRISPLAAAVYERERDIAGKGDGTATAPDGPQGGSSGRARKRDEAANRKEGKKSAKKKAGKSAKSKR